MSEEDENIDYTVDGKVIFYKDGSYTIEDGSKIDGESWPHGKCVGRQPNITKLFTTNQVLVWMVKELFSVIKSNSIDIGDHGDRCNCGDCTLHNVKMEDIVASIDNYNLREAAKNGLREMAKDYDPNKKHNFSELSEQEIKNYNRRREISSIKQALADTIHKSDAYSRELTPEELDCIKEFKELCNEESDDDQLDNILIRLKNLKDKLKKYIKVKK